MSTKQIVRTGGAQSTVKSARAAFWVRLGPAAAAGVLLMLGAAGCETNPPPARYGDADTKAAATAAPTPARSEAVLLREGDVVRITFPGTPNLDAQSPAQPIGRDGKITLPLNMGEYQAAGKSRSEMEKELLKKYESQLVTKEVAVIVVSSTYTVYVTGSVLRQGKLTYDRPVTALEVVMEAGVDYAKANLKKVAVVRQENGRTLHYYLNLKDLLKKDQPTEPFLLKPGDIISVPERFTWF